MSYIKVCILIAKGQKLDNTENTDIFPTKLESEKLIKKYT